MNKRENLLSLLHRNGYEQVPVHFDLCPELAEKMEGMFDPDGIGIPWKNICDSRLVPAVREEYERYYRDLQPGAEIDAWGVAHEKGSAAAKHMTYMRHPLDGLDSLEAVKEYPFPALKLEEEAQKRDVEACIAAGLAPVGNMQMTIWEQSWYLRGMENLMVDMICNEPVAEYIFDAVTAINTRRAVAFARAGVDILYLGDDIGMQRQIMMSRELYRTWLWPRLKGLIDAVKAVKPDLLVFYHTCGFAEPLIGDLIEAGVDVLNPIQPECMDFAKIHSEYGGALSFHGTIGTQTTMPFGTPDEVRSAVFRNLDIAGPSGGLFVAPTHMLEPEVPPENVLAYIQACHDYTK